MSRFERWSRAKRGLPVDDEIPLHDEDTNQHSAEQLLTEELDEPPVTHSGIDDPSPEPGSLDHTLPDPDSLDAGSDFSAFMSPGVSSVLRRKALRRLWSTGDYNVRDGLNDYDHDFKAQLKPMAAEMAEKVRQWTHKLEDGLEASGDTPHDHHVLEDADTTLDDAPPPSCSSAQEGADRSEYDGSAACKQEER